jgi:hypothetical protein
MEKCDVYVFILMGLFQIIFAKERGRRLLEGIQLARFIQFPCHLSCIPVTRVKLIDLLTDVVQFTGLVCYRPGVRSTACIIFVNKQRTVRMSV